MISICGCFCFLELGLCLIGQKVRKRKGFAGYDDCIWVYG